jgi:penicillin-binding protein 1C
MRNDLLKKALLIGSIVIAIAGVLIAGLTVRDSQTLPNDLRQLITASVKPQLLDRTGRPLTITYQNRWNAHNVVALHRIPAFLQSAFILAEDKRFYQHRGIDWLARLNAVWQNVTAFKSLRGASTLSEQVVRMIHKRPRTMWAKWLEGWEARELESKFDKATILEFYLNQVPYAAQRRGVQQAATFYFDRDVATLNEREMLALAVLVRAPSHFDLKKSTSRLNGRLNLLLERADKGGLITDKHAVETSTLVLKKPKTLLNVSHFASHVYRNAGRQQQQIKTTLDSDFQRIAQSLLDQRLSKLKNRQVENAGMIVVDHQTDETLVWAIGETKHKQGGSYDSILTKRQPGSTLKPFVYALAMEQGWTAATIIDDSPLKEGVGQGVHAYRNYSNRHYGKLPLRNALGNSLNIPAIKAAQFVGVEPLISTLNKLGIKDLHRRSVDYGHGIALGNGEVSLHSLVGAYAVLARQGVYRPIKSTFSQSQTLNRRVFTPEVSSIIGNILSDPSARSLEFGYGGTLSLPVQTAVKTGTSNDYRDAWVVGYNHRYVVGIWMGNLDNQAMDRVTGSSGPALVLRSMFAELNRNTKTQPLSLSRKLVAHNVCIDSDQESSSNCQTRSEWFRPEKLANEGSTGLETKTESKIGYRLAHPIDQMLVARDPRIPDQLETLEFKLNEGKGVQRVEWYLNDKMVATTESDKYNWPLETGQHTVKAKVFSEATSEPTMTKVVSVLVK